MREHFEVFISYRHKENRVLANRLYDIFTNQYEMKVFRDEEELHFGDFRSQLIKNNKNSDFLLLLLTPDTLTRCPEEGDWITKEINLFAQNKKPIIPVCLNGFSFETANIPDCVSGLLQYKNNAIICNDANYVDTICQQAFKKVRAGWTERQLYEAHALRDYFDHENNVENSYYYDSALLLRDSLVLSILYAACLFAFISLRSSGEFVYILFACLGCLITVLGFLKSNDTGTPFLTILLDEPILEFLKRFLMVFLFASIPITLVTLLLPFGGYILSALVSASIHGGNIGLEGYYLNAVLISAALPLVRNLIKSIHYFINVLISIYAPFPKIYLIFEKRKKLYKTLKVLAWVFLVPAIILCGVIAIRLTVGVK